MRLDIGGVGWGGYVAGWTWGGEKGGEGGREIQGGRKEGREVPSLLWVAVGGMSIEERKGGRERKRERAHEQGSE